MAALTLNQNDPAVITARNAEEKLFERYGLQAKDHYILLPDQGIHVRVSEIGSGVPLIIVPGNTGDVFPLIPLLAQIKGRRIIAINRPGGGLSEGMDHTAVNIRQFAVSTLKTVLDHFKLDQADVVAHSMGAHWSLWLAMDRPHLVRSLTLLGNPGNVMKGSAPWFIKLLARPVFSKLLFRLLMPKDKSKALRGLTTMGHSKALLSSLPREFNDAYYYFRLLPHYRVSSISLLANMAPNINAQQLGQLHQPVLFLLGTKDTFASVKTGREIADAIPKCEFRLINGAGHLPWLESPGECGQLINNFLKPG